MPGQRKPDLKALWLVLPKAFPARAGMNVLVEQRPGHCVNVMKNCVSSECDRIKSQSQMIITAILQKTNVLASVSSSLLQTWKISNRVADYIWREALLWEETGIMWNPGLGFSHCCQTPPAQAQSSLAAGLDLIPAGRPSLSIGCRFLLDVLQVTLGVLRLIQVVRCQLLDDDF